MRGDLPSPTCLQEESKRSFAMDNLTLIVLGGLFAVILFFLGSIVYAFFFGASDLSSDDLLKQIQQSRGGEFRRIVPGRTMLELVNGSGNVLVGYWLQSDVGYQVRNPSFHVRWCPSQTSDLPEFKLQEVTGAGTMMKGFRQSDRQLQIQDETFDLLVEETSSERDQAALMQRLVANVSEATDAAVPVELSHHQGNFSCRYREAIMTHDRAEELLDRTLELFAKLA